MKNNKRAQIECGSSLAFEAKDLQTGHLISANVPIEDFEVICHLRGYDQGTDTYEFRSFACMKNDRRMEILNPCGDFVVCKIPDMQWDYDETLDFLDKYGRLDEVLTNMVYECRQTYSNPNIIGLICLTQSVGVSTSFVYKSNIKEIFYKDSLNGGFIITEYEGTLPTVTALVTFINGGDGKVLPIFNEISEMLSWGIPLTLVEKGEVPEALARALGVSSEKHSVNPMPAQ